MQAASNRSRDNHGSTPGIPTQTAESGTPRRLYLRQKPVCPEGVDQDVFKAFIQTGKVPGSAMDIASIAVWAIKSGEDAALHALLNSGDMKHLDLACRDLNAGDAVILAHALKANTTLCSLHLAMNRLEAEGVKVIAAALEGHPALLELDLGSNRIEPDGFEAIASLLEKNGCLLTLNLESNEGGCEGAGMIAQALLKNNGLTSLNLAGNELDHTCGASIGALLQGNRTLTSLDLRANRLGVNDDVSRMAFAKAVVSGLDGNTVLTSLHLDFNNLDSYLNHATPATLRGRIPDLLKRNRMLEALSEKDAYACSQLFPGRPMSMDEGGVMATAMIMAAPDTAAHERMMVEVHSAVNLLAPRADPQ